jgi:hypothetical protein
VPDHLWNTARSKSSESVLSHGGTTVCIPTVEPPADIIVGPLKDGNVSVVTVTPAQGMAKLGVEREDLGCFECPVPNANPVGGIMENQVVTPPPAVARVIRGEEDSYCVPVEADKG